MIMKIRDLANLIFAFCFLLCGFVGEVNAKLKVVTTLPDYASLAEFIGGERVSVQAIVRGDQDAHFIRPRPSFATAVRDADVLVATGLDLELWLQTVIDNSGNRGIRSGQSGYVSASTGMHLLEKTNVLSRSEGGLHIYGNPHVTTSPINMKVAAENITTGLIKNDPEGKEIYRGNLERLCRELDERLFGKELVKILSGEVLCELSQQGRLWRFLEENDYQGNKLIGYLGGWMKKMEPVRNLSLITYHANWVYFTKLFGLRTAGTIEPKPGIEPSPRHIAELLKTMESEDVRVILAVDYFDRRKIESVVSRSGAKAAIVSFYVGGEPGTEDYFKLVDHWLDCILEAAKESGATN